MDTRSTATPLDIKLFLLLALEHYCRFELIKEHEVQALSTISDLESDFKILANLVGPAHRVIVKQGLRRLSTLRDTIRAKQNPPMILFYSDV